MSNDFASSYYLEGNNSSPPSSFDNSIPPIFTNNSSTSSFSNQPSTSSFSNQPSTSSFPNQSLPSSFPNQPSTSSFSTTQIIPNQHPPPFTNQTINKISDKDNINISGYEIEVGQYNEMVKISTTLLIVIVFIVVFFIICYIIWISNINTTTNTQPIKLNNPYVEYPIDKNYGGTNALPYNYMNGTEINNKKDCTKEGNNIWNSKKNICQCDDNYFGPRCNIQPHNLKYSKVNLSESEVEYTILDTINDIDYLSFNIDGSEVNTCTNYCDSIRECKGVKYENGECILLNSALKVKSPITYNPYMGSFYIKTDPILENKILLLKTTIPKGYFYERDDILSLKINSVNEVNFLPKFIINNSNLVGIWSTKPFDSKDFNNILSSNKKNGGEIYIDRGSNKNSYSINFSSGFTLNRKHYVMYINNNINNNINTKYNNKNINKNINKKINKNKKSENLFSLGNKKYTYKINRK